MGLLSMTLAKSSSSWNLMGEHLAGEVFTVRDGRELGSLGPTGTEQTGNLTDKDFIGQESVVFFWPTF